MKLIVLTVTMAFALFGSKVVADPYDQYRRLCSDGQQVTINSAIEETKRLLDGATSALPPMDSTTGSIFKRWFGGTDGDSDPKVKEIYQGIRTSLVFSSTWCPNQSTPDSDPGTLAWVPVDAVSEIFFEPLFFQLSTTGADSQSGTVLHEAGHLSFISDVVDSDVTGDDKPDYGVASAEQLARTRPDLARRTADNLQYFAEDIAYSIP